MAGFASRLYDLVTTQASKGRSLIDQLGIEESNSSGALRAFWRYLLDNLKTIIVGDPNQLSKIIQSVNKNHAIPFEFAKRKIKKNRKSKLEDIFSWEKFSKSLDGREFLWELLKELGVEVCPYCNRNFTTTLTKAKKAWIRPDFDHYFFKAKYPFLSLSLFNLIPSCSVCNSKFKKISDFSLSKNIHPYMDGFENSFVFQLVPVKSGGLFCSKQESDYILTMEGKGPDSSKIDRCRENAKAFGLIPLYNQAHKSQAIEIILKCQILRNDGSSFIKNVRKLLNENTANAKLSENDVYAFIFSNFYRPEDMLKRPLAKLTRDVFHQHIPAKIEKAIFCSESGIASTRSNHRRF